MEPLDLAGIARRLYLEEGYSCSESVLHALKKSAWDIPEALLRSVSGLRTGIGGSGCVCGALMAVVLTVGYVYGADKAKANQLSAELHNKFRGQFKSACCRVLTRKYDFKSQARKEFCAGLVESMISELGKMPSEGGASS